MAVSALLYTAKGKLLQKLIKSSLSQQPKVLRESAFLSLT